MSKNRNTRKMCEICSKSTKKTEQRHGNGNGLISEISFQ